MHPAAAETVNALDAAISDLLCYQGFATDTFGRAASGSAAAGTSCATVDSGVRERVVRIVSECDYAVEVYKSLRCRPV